MANLDNLNDQDFVEDVIQDSIISLTYTISLSTAKFGCAGRIRIVAQASNAFEYPTYICIR